MKTHVFLVLIILIFTASAASKWTSEETSLPPAANKSSASFNGKAWSAGGTNGTYSNDIWSSVDGVNWVESSNAGWTPRDAFCMVNFNNGSGDYLFALGGKNSSGSNSEVWRSADGAAWTSLGEATWTPRNSFACAVFAGKIFVLGGDVGGPDNTVYSTADGINWATETLSAGWTQRAGMKALVFDGKLYVLGGKSGNTYYNDVWYSSNGGSWTKVTDAADWDGRSDFEAGVIDGKIVIVGGEKHGNVLDDSWESFDGILWTRVTGSDKIKVKGASSLFFQDKLMLLGGYNGTNYTSELSFITAGATNTVIKSPELGGIWLLALFIAAGFAVLRKAG